MPLSIVLDEVPLPAEVDAGGLGETPLRLVLDAHHLDEAWQEIVGGAPPFRRTSTWKAKI